jgi:hypothetical protein
VIPRFVMSRYAYPNASLKFRAVGDSFSRNKMWNKPFKPPLLKHVSKPPGEKALVEREACEPSLSPRPAKKRRLIEVEDDDDSLPSRRIPTIPPTFNAPRKPLINVLNPVAVAQATSPVIDGHEGFYLVLW